MWNHSPVWPAEHYRSLYFTSAVCSTLQTGVYKAGETATSFLWQQISQERSFQICTSVKFIIAEEFETPLTSLGVWTEVLSPDPKSGDESGVASRTQADERVGILEQENKDPLPLAARFLSSSYRCTPLWGLTWFSRIRICFSQRYSSLPLKKSVFYSLGKANITDLSSVLKCKNCHRIHKNHKVGRDLQDHWVQPIS